MSVMFYHIEVEHFNIAALYAMFINHKKYIENI